MRGTRMRRGETRRCKELQDVVRNRRDQDEAAGHVRGLLVIGMGEVRGWLISEGERVVSGCVARMLGLCILGAERSV